jgi:predicted nucleic acid-binding protein
MDLVVDANILFAALIKDSTTSELMLHEDIHLYAPEYLLEEFEKYKELIKGKTNRNDSEFRFALDIFQRRIKLVPHKEIKSLVKNARAISPDIKDIPYVALAMKLQIAIWSNDKNLKNKQDSVDVYSTEDLVRLFL